jgi:hypothetical protein
MESGRATFRSQEAEGVVDLSLSKRRLQNAKKNRKPGRKQIRPKGGAKPSPEESARTAQVAELRAALKSSKA